VLRAIAEAHAVDEVKDIRGKGPRYRAGRGSYERHQTLAQLVAAVDAQRTAGQPLASALRVLAQLVPHGNRVGTNTHFRHGLGQKAGAAEPARIACQSNATIAASPSAARAVLRRYRRKLIV